MTAKRARGPARDSGSRPDEPSRPGDLPRRDVAECGAGLRLATCAILLFASGCVSHVAALSSADAARLAAARGTAGTCAVVDARATGGTSRRTEAVRRTGLFADVCTIARSDDAAGVDWVLLEAPIPRTLHLHEPLGTVITAGIIPYIASDEAAHVWLAWRAGAPEVIRRAEWTEQDAWVMGWIGLPLLLLPSWWTSGSASHAQASADRLGIELIRAGVVPPTSDSGP